MSSLWEPSHWLLAPVPEVFVFLRLLAYFHFWKLIHVMVLISCLHSLRKDTELCVCLHPANGCTLSTCLFDTQLTILLFYIPFTLYSSPLKKYFMVIDSILNCEYPASSVNHKYIWIAIYWLPSMYTVINISFNSQQKPYKVNIISCILPGQG